MRKASRDRPDPRKPRAKLARSMGRQPFPEGKARSKGFLVRLTPAELERLQEAAARLQVSIADLMRDGAELEIARLSRKAKKPG